VCASKSPFNLPLNFVSPGKAASGLKISRDVSCHTNLPSIAGVNSTYAVFIQIFVDSGGTTLRENTNCRTVVCGIMPDGSGPAR
jgi:hypothetical protein